MSFKLVGNDFYINQQNTATIPLKFTDSLGADINITGSTVYFTAKLTPEDLDADAIIKKVITIHSDPTHGITSVPLLSTDTDQSLACYVYELLIKLSTTEIHTVLSGYLIIDPELRNI
jgi:hypothetical protein